MVRSRRTDTRLKKANNYLGNGATEIDRVISESFQGVQFSVMMCFKFFLENYALNVSLIKYSSKSTNHVDAFKHEATSWFVLIS